MSMLPNSAASASSSSEKQLAPETLQFILQEQVWRQHRVVRVNTAQGQVVIKSQRPARGATPYRLLNLVAGLLKASFLKAAPAPGGTHAQTIEVQRLRTLGSLGLPVPAVLHVDQEFFVMESLGEEDLSHAIGTQPEQAYAHWHRGGELLLRVHAKDQYLSQAFARNFVMQDDQLGLIDFEDDPLEAMSLPEAQARDWLAYLHSTAWILSDQHKAMAHQLEEWLKQESHEVRALMRDAATRLAWTRHFSSNRKRWGRDLVSIQAVGQLLYIWTRRENDGN